MSHPFLLTVANAPSKADAMTVAKGCENMALITESELRKHYRNQNLKEVSVYEVAEGTILTPSAKSFLTDHQIELRYV